MMKLSAGGVLLLASWPVRTSGVVIEYESPSPYYTTSSSPGTGGPGSYSQGEWQNCQNDPASDLECLWCLQWDCEQGYFDYELPYCYSYVWSPYDDYRPESDTYVDQCSSLTCCSDEFTGVSSCKGYDCPAGTENLLAPCMSDLIDLSTPFYPPCVQDECCGVLESTCDTYFDPSTGLTLCSTGFVPIGNPESASCGIGEECNDGTCCEEAPTPAPSILPSPAPTAPPTTAPTEAPTTAPSPAPSTAPSPGPSRAPSPAPSQASTPAPSVLPSPAPTTPPTTAPTEAAPTPAPSPAPSTAPSPAPSRAPSPAPSQDPTRAPSRGPTASPTRAQTRTPTQAPSRVPTPEPTQGVAPTPVPSPAPSTAPSPAPSRGRTPAPSQGIRPTPAPPSAPSMAPSPAPSLELTPTPSQAPALSSAPSIAPTPAPSQAPSLPPTPAPTQADTSSPVEPVSTSPTEEPALTAAPTESRRTPAPVPAEDSREAEPPSDQPPTTVYEFSSRTASPTFESEIVYTTTAAAGAVSVFAWSGVAAVTAGSMFGGAAVSSTSSLASSPAAAERTVVTHAGAAQTSVSIRQPSVTIAMILVTQVQFLATLSLVDSTGATDSGLLELARNLRWVNLWPPASVGRSFLSSGGRSNLFQNESSGCVFAGTSLTDIGALVFLGNIGLFSAILLGIFVLHIVLAAGLEAFWLSKERAKDEIAKARRRGMPIRELMARRTDKVSHHSGSDFDPDDVATSASDDGGISQEVAERSANTGIDYAEDGIPVWSRPRSREAMLADCRYHSRSAWLYFPHIELLFLLFAFEGAVTSQLATLRDGACPWVVCVAGAALVVYPFLMVVLSYRTFCVRVRPDTLIVFEPAPAGEDDGSERKRSLLSKVRTGLVEDHSMFAWADKGAWETAETTNEDTRREGDQFRIGFEPLFVDFTKKTSWFMVYSLVEMTAIACTAVFVKESVAQLLVFCGLHFLSFLLLTVFKPFANSAVNTMGACLLLTDAVCMAWLAVAVLRWQGTSRAEDVDRAVMITQLVALVALIVPMYVDSATVVLGAIGEKLKRTPDSETLDGQTKEEAREERGFIRRFIFRTWVATWCTMLGSNLSACVKDTSRGVRKFDKSAFGRQSVTKTAARTGPYCAAGPSTGDTINCG